MSTPKLRRRHAGWAALAVLGLTLTACSGGGDDASSSGGTDTGTGGDPVVITVGVTDPAQLIPGRQTIAYDFSMAVWAPLTWIDADGTMTYVAADSIESDDQQTWTIALADGFTFHDGTDVTAQSYVDSWNAAAYGPNAWENSGQLATIVGYDDLNPAEGEPTTTEMSGLTVVDDLTFTVELEAPDSQFPLQLSQAQTAFYPMPESAFADFDAYNAHPVGNGPFMIEGDYTEAESITTVRYDAYPGEEPTVDGITFVPYTDQVTAYTDVLAGNLDVAGVPANRLTQAEADFGERLYAFEAPGISFLGLPLWDERYQNPDVRKAISMAIDRDTINDVIYAGTNVPATAYTPAIEAGTPEGICGEYCEYDPEAAAALLESAGGFEGTIDIYYPGGAGLDELYTAIANQLRQNLGVEATATPSADWAEFADNRQNGTIDGPFFSRWGALYPSQQNTLRVFFVEGGGCPNCIPYYEDDIEAQIAAADSAATPEEAYAIYEGVQTELVDALPAPPLFFETYKYVTSERIAELPTSAVGNPTFRLVTVSEDA